MKTEKVGTEKCLQNSHRKCLSEMITFSRHMKDDNIKLGHIELK
jgi:hypothetical protein